MTRLHYYLEWRPEPSQHQHSVELIETSQQNLEQH